MELSEIRKELDRLDEALVTILAQRMSLIPKVAEYKIANNIKRFQPERETEILKAKSDIANELNLNPELVKDLFKRIIKDAHRIEKEMGLD